jgi:hypothetical protein
MQETRQWAWRLDGADAFGGGERIDEHDRPSAGLSVPASARILLRTDAHNRLRHRSAVDRRRHA